MNYKQSHIINRFKLISIIYAIVTIWLGEYTISILTDSSYNFIEKLSPRIIKTILIYLPFGLLLFFKRSNLPTNDSKNVFYALICSYVTGWIASILLWGYYFYEGYTNIVYDKIGDANIGLGMILLFSPIFICLLIFSVYFISSNYFSGNKD